MNEALFLLQTLLIVGFALGALPFNWLDGPAANQTVKQAAAAAPKK